jgi:ribosomal protein L35AE/L33A
VSIPKRRCKSLADFENMSIETNILSAVYVKGKHLSFQRGKRNTNPNCSLVKIEGVDDTNAAKYVLQVHTD